MHPVQPTVRYLIVCEDVQVDPEHPRRVTLTGLISSIRSLEQPAYPLWYREICVFLQLTECRGAAEGRIEIQHSDSEDVVFRSKTRTIPFGSDPLEVVGASSEFATACSEKLDSTGFNFGTMTPWWLNSRSC